MDWKLFFRNSFLINKLSFLLIYSTFFLIFTVDSKGVNSKKNGPSLLEEIQIDY